MSRIIVLWYRYFFYNGDSSRQGCGLEKTRYKRIGIPAVKNMHLCIIFIVIYNFFCTFAL